MELRVYVDASSRDDGTAIYGYVIQSQGVTIAEGNGHYPGGFTSTPAEHIAADIAYRIIKLFCRRLGEKVERITLYSDSMNIMGENEVYRRPKSIKANVHKGGLTEQYKIPIEYRWVSSKDNEADRLVSNPERRRKDMYFRSLREEAEFKVGDIVEVKPNAPGYTLWYKNKAGIVASLEFNDNGELRYKVNFGDEILPFGEWELRRR
ncbi:hypothetical protein ES703_27525 [subsurface metagenome]